MQGHGVQIAVLGCYINLADPDLGRAGARLARFKEYCATRGISVAASWGTETGSLNSGFSFTRESRGGSLSDGAEQRAGTCARAERFACWWALKAWSAT